MDNGNLEEGILADLKPANGDPALAIAAAPSAALHLSGEFSADQILDLHFEQRPLPFLTRDDVVFEGTSMLLAAREKTGKSTLARHLCHEWVMEGRSVLYFSEEWSRVWQRQLQALGFELGMGHFQVVEALGKAAPELLERARKGPEEIIVVDTCTWLFGINLNHREAVVETLKPWVTLCSLGKTVILLAHLTKRGELEGSHAFGAGVDAIITYKDHGSQADLRVVNVRSRMHSDMQKPFGVRKQGINFSLEDLPHELTLTHSQEEVFQVLPLEAVQAVTWQQVAAATGFKEGKTRLILRQLVDMKLARDVLGVLGTGGGRGHMAKYIAVLDEDLVAG